MGEGVWLINSEGRCTLCLMQNFYLMFMHCYVLSIMLVEIQSLKI